MSHDNYEGILQVLRDAERQYKQQIESVSMSERLGYEIERINETRAMLDKISMSVGNDVTPRWIQEMYGSSVKTTMENYLFGFQNTMSSVSQNWENKNIVQQIKNASENFKYIPDYPFQGQAIPVSNVVERFVEFERVKANFFEHQYGIDQDILQNKLIASSAVHDFNVNYIQRESIVSLDEVRAAGFSRIYNLDNMGMISGVESIKAVFEEFNWDKIQNMFGMENKEILSLKENLFDFGAEEKKDLIKSKASKLANSVATVTKDKKKSILLLSESLTNPSTYLPNSKNAALWLIMLLLITGIIDRELVKSFLFNTAAAILLKDLIKDK